MPAVAGGIHDLVSRKAGLILQAELENPLMMFVGESDDDAFHLHYKGSANRGSTERVMFTRPNYDTLTKPYGSPIVGNEEEGTVEYDEVRLDWHTLDGKVPNVVMDQQIINWDPVDKEIDRLGSQWSYTFQRWMVNQLAGNVNATASGDGAQSHYPLSGSNSVTAHDSAHIVRAFKSDDTEPGTDSAIDSTCLLTTSTLSTARSRFISRATVENPIAPCNTPWGKLFPVLVGTQGLDQLRSDDPRNRFVPICDANLSGGMDYMESALAHYTGYIYEDMLILKVPALDDPTYKVRGLNGTSQVANTGVAIFLGANAAQMVVGENLGEDWIGYSEHKIHTYLSMLTYTVCGFKRTIPSTWNQSWAAGRITHYSSVA